MSSVAQRTDLVEELLDQGVLAESGLFLFLSLLQAHLVVPDQLIFEDSRLVFDLEGHVGAVKVKRIHLEVAIDVRWVPEEAMRSSRLKILSIRLKEFLVVFPRLILASTWISNLLIWMHNS